MTEGSGLDYKVRPAAPEDANAAARVQLEGWRTAYGAIFPAEVLQSVDLPAQVGKWRQRVSGEDGRFAFVAAVGAEVVGVIAGGPPGDAGEAGDAEIYSLYVLSWWRGRRVGEALMAAAFEHLAKTGRRRVHLWVLAANQRGRAFFRRLDGVEGRTRDRPSIGGLMRPSTLHAWDDAAAAARTWHDRRMAVEFRQADFDDAAGIARVQIDTWRAAYKRLMPPRLLGEMSDVRIAAFWAQIIADSQGRSFCLVACIGERVIGFASCGPRQHSSEVDMGEVYALYVLPEFQGRGIGRRLVAHAFERMLELGINTGRIWTLRDNAPARAFYAHIGGTQTDTGYNDIGGIRYPEVAYDWPDLRHWKETR